MVPDDDAKLTESLRLINGGRANSPRSRRRGGTDLAAIDDGEVRWLMPGFIPIGFQTHVIGEPGDGKSMFVAWLTARVTTGDLPWLKDRVDPRGVAYFNREDSAAHVLRPRMRAAGAIPHLIHVLDESDADEAYFNLTDHDAIVSRAERVDAQLVVFDPLLSFFGDVNDHLDREVRPLLESTGLLAREHDFALMTVGHLNRRSDVGGGIGRSSGAGALVSVPRVVLLVARDYHDGALVVECVKNNLTDRSKLPRLLFRFNDNCIEYVGETDRSAEDIIAARRRPQREKKEKQPKEHQRPGPKTEFSIERAITEAFELLDSEEVLRSDLRKALSARGFSRATAHRAMAAVVDDPRVLVRYDKRRYEYLRLAPEVPEEPTPHDRDPEYDD